MGSKKYYSELNIFRGLIVTWVCIGHSTLAAESGVLNPDFYFYTYAYSFHMPAFFLLSATLFGRKVLAAKSIEDKKNLIVNRAAKLLIPYYFFTVVSFVLKLFMDKYAYNPIDFSAKYVLNVLFLGKENPNGGLWFLFYLFLYSVLALILNKIDFRISTAVLFIVKLILTAFSIKTIFFEYAYIFFFGILVSTYYEKISSYINKKAQENGLYFISAGTLVAALFLVYLKCLNKNAFLSILICVYNIVVWYILSVCIANKANIFKKPFDLIGNYGMDIYMIGYYVQIVIRVILYSMLKVNITICSVLMFICSIILPIIISKCIVRKFKITRILVLGDI